MKDRVSLYPGRVKLVPVSGQANTYDMERADQPTQVGDPMNKNTLLKDATAALFGLGADAVPDDAFVKLHTEVSEKMSMDLLWENASPTSSFEAQTVSVDLSGYDMIAVETYTPEQGYPAWGLAAGGYKMDIFHVRNDTTYLLDLWSFMRSGNYRTICYASRNFTIDESGILFKNAFGNTSRGSSAIPGTDPYESANGFLIPTRIFGIKGVSA